MEFDFFFYKVLYFSDQEYHESEREDYKRRRSQLLYEVCQSFSSSPPPGFPIIWGRQYCIAYHSSILSCPVRPTTLTPEFPYLFYTGFLSSSPSLSWYWCIYQSSQHVPFFNSLNMSVPLFVIFFVTGATFSDPLTYRLISDFIFLRDSTHPAASKGNQILGMIRRNITYKEKGLIVPLYKAIVRPHLEYCIQAWRPYLRKDIDILEKVQRRTTKLITGLRDLSYDDRLKECGLTTLETRRLRGDQIEVFKILNGHENIDPNIFFKIKTGKITRGHDFTLVKGQNRLDFRKYSFSQRTVNEWNKLSADCVHSSSVNMFKNRIDNYLVRAGYT